MFPSQKCDPRLMLRNHLFASMRPGCFHPRNAVVMVLCLAGAVLQ